MKRLKRWLLPLITVLLIGAGAAMPWAAARVQDLYGIASQEVLPFDPVSLTLRKESEIGAVLRLMGNIYDQGEWSRETRLTEEDACAAALDALVLLDQYGLLESGDMGPYGYVEPDIPEQLKSGGGSSATPLLFISEDAASAIVWVCHWKGTNAPGYTLLVDDATGLAVTGFIACPFTEDPETAWQRLERWRTFFQDCYGIEIPAIEEAPYDAGNHFILRFDPEDGQGECGLSVCLYNYEMDFYPCSRDELALSRENREEDRTPMAVLPGPS